MSCDDLGFNCGPAGDGCGGLLECGACSEDEKCGDSGKPSVCGLIPGKACIPLTCQDRGWECGPAGDGCGGTLDCGYCDYGKSCGRAGLRGCARREACLRSNEGCHDETPLPPSPVPPSAAMTSRLDLHNKRVLVTGASSGLGLEMARQLARDHGAHPVLVARRKDRLEALRDDLAKFGAKAEVIAADMTKPADIARLFEESTKSPLAGVILNAGVTFFGHATEQSEESIATLIATNVQSVVDLTLRYVRYYQTNREAGAILLVSSMASLQPMPFQATYGGSKAFVTSFGLAMAEELRESRSASPPSALAASRPTWSPTPGWETSTPRPPDGDGRGALRRARAVGVLLA